MDLKYYVGRVRKAIVAGVGGAVAAYSTAFADGAVTTEEWIYVVATGLVLAFVTYRVPNTEEVK